MAGRPVKHPQEGTVENAGVRFPPPLIFVLALVMAALLERVWPLPISGDDITLPVRGVAYLLMAAGLFWMLWGIVTFARAQTGIIPHHPATRIVTHGPYRFGRNPMYVGFITLYLGGTILLDSWWAVLLLPFAVALLIRFVIRREERYLTHAFGAEYLEYCSRVGRWLG